jgi:hypothetical protein
MQKINVSEMFPSDGLKESKTRVSENVYVFVWKVNEGEKSEITRALKSLQEVSYSVRKEGGSYIIRASTVNQEAVINAMKDNRLPVPEETTDYSKLKLTSSGMYAKYREVFKFQQKERVKEFIDNLSDSDLEKLSDALVKMRAYEAASVNAPAFNRPNSYAIDVVEGILSIAEGRNDADKAVAYSGYAKELVARLEALKSALKEAHPDAETVQSLFKEAIDAGEPTFYNAGKLVNEIKEIARALRESLPSDASGNLGAVLDAILDESGGFGNFSRRVLRGDLDNSALGKKGWISYDVRDGETFEFVSATRGSGYGFEGDPFWTGAGSGGRSPGPAVAGGPEGAGTGRPVAPGDSGSGAPVQAGSQQPVPRGGLPEHAGAGDVPDDAVGASDVPGTQAGKTDQPLGGGRAPQDQGVSGEARSVKERLEKELYPALDRYKAFLDEIAQKPSSISGAEGSPLRYNYVEAIYPAIRAMEDTPLESIPEVKRYLMDKHKMSEGEADRLLHELMPGKGDPLSRNTATRMSRRRRKPIDDIVDDVVDEITDDISRRPVREMMDEAVG